MRISTKEPWRLGIRKGAYEALVATGREAFVKLREAAGAYGELLDVLKAHKWIYIKLAADDAFRAAYKLKTEKRSIDRLREAYGQNDGETPTVSRAEADKPGAVIVAALRCTCILLAAMAARSLLGATSAMSKKR